MSEAMNAEHKHEWFVFTTYAKSVRIGVGCDCGATGYIPKPTKEEWFKAYDAPGNPYLWTGGNERVKQ